MAINVIQPEPPTPSGRGSGARIPPVERIAKRVALVLGCACLVLAAVLSLTFR